MRRIAASTSPDHSGERHDVEDTLAAAEQIDYLLAGAGEHGPLADEDEVGRRRSSPTDSRRHSIGAAGPGAG